MNVFSAEGKVKYDSLQLSINRRMSDGVQFTVGVYVLEDHRLVEDGHSHSRVLRPEQGRNGSPHRLNASLDLRAALRRRQEMAQ